MSKQKADVSLNKITKSQVRRMAELSQFYQMVQTYSLREEAYAAVLQAYIAIKKQIKPSKK